MPPLTRDEAIAVLEETWSELGEQFGRLTDEQMVVRNAIGGGDWSAKDLLGHIAAWERYSLESLEELGRGERPHIDEELTTEGATDRLNDEAIERAAGLPLTQVRADSRATHNQLVETIAVMTDEEWNAKYNPEIPGLETVGEMLGGLTAAPKRPFAHPVAHLADLRAFADSCESGENG